MGPRGKWAQRSIEAAELVAVVCTDGQTMPCGTAYHVARSALKLAAFAHMYTSAINRVLVRLARQADSTAWVAIVFATPPCAGYGARPWLQPPAVRPTSKHLTQRKPRVHISRLQSV